VEWRFGCIGMATVGRQVGCIGMETVRWPMDVAISQPIRVKCLPQKLLVACRIARTSMRSPQRSLVGRTVE
jgi:hypothetical protein